MLVTGEGDDAGDDHQFWAYTRVYYQDFAEWWVYIGSLMTMHGMELEDEPPPDDDDEPGDGGGYFDDEEEEDEEEETPTIGQRIGNFFKRLFRR